MAVIIKQTSGTCALVSIPAVIPCH